MLRSISTRAISAVILLIFLCSGTFLYLSLLEHERFYFTSESQNLNGITKNVSEELVSKVENNPDLFSLTTTLLDLEQFPNIQYALIYDKDWKPLAQFNSNNFINQESKPKAIPPFNVRAIDLEVQKISGDLVSLKIIGDPNYILGYLLTVSKFDDSLSKSNMELFQRLIPISILIILIIILISVWFSKSMFQPLVNLSEFTQSIRTTGDIDNRFDYQGEDEVANLAKNVNSMLQRIKDGEENTAKYLKQLELQQVYLENLVNTDPLTELPNRKLFMEILEKRMSSAKSSVGNLSLLFLDLDHFKGINDTLGHETGDVLIVKVSKLIQSILSEDDILSHWGGDEFLVLLADVGNDLADYSINVSQTIIHLLQRPISIRDWEIHTSVSIGIADSISSNYSSESIISNAEIAMYQAKERGRNSFSIFRQQLQALTMRKMLVANALTKAISQNELDVYYQAKVCPEGKVCGFEALVRWKSSLDGFISPMEFIPIAEQSGRITQITRFVLEKVVNDMESIEKAVGYPVPISVNLSAQDIKDIEFLGFVKKQIAAASSKSYHIEFEVTESAYLENFDIASDFFQTLQELGCKIALDDFGTGYSSMSYLTRIRMDTLKIDQHFVREMSQSSNERLIIETIISLAQKMKLAICAEGVENKEQKDILFNLGCSQIQGYYFSKPCPLNDISSQVLAINSMN